MATNSKSVDAVTAIILSVFRLNARLLDQGDKLVKPLALTSARWQVLGAVALAGEPLTAPQIAAAMGITRQAVQKQLNLALDDALMEMEPNPRHLRSPLYSLSAKGQTVFDKAMALQNVWAAALAKGLPLPELQSTAQTLATLEKNLNAKKLP